MVKAIVSEGKAYIAGSNVLTEPKKVRTKIGYVSQLGGADPNATVRENLELTGKLGRLLDFHELLSRFVRSLSGGQKRRVEIAQGLDMMALLFGTYGWLPYWNLLCLAA